ncbi:MAG: hypothetical protein A2Z27_04880 [candidate division Zixibacteria bacterium RBG_16_50_21]|nr:MAG: hypothetical protein A2Z27_04880 [candidate division Zixibacteria bacterium RBG_16_50_21]
MNPEVPTGSTSEIVQQYFNYLYQYWLSKTSQNYYIHWDTLAWVALWIFVLTAGFYAYTRWQRYAHEPKEPYPVESYNGYIQETNGPVGPFLNLFFGAVFIWLVVMTILNLINGQLY